MHPLLLPACRRGPVQSVQRHHVETSGGCGHTVVHLFVISLGGVLCKGIYLLPWSLTYNFYTHTVYECRDFSVAQDYSHEMRVLLVDNLMIRNLSFCDQVIYQGRASSFHIHCIQSGASSLLYVQAVCVGRLIVIHSLFSHCTCTCRQFP